MIRKPNAVENLLYFYENLQACRDNQFDNIFKMIFEIYEKYNSILHHDAQEIDEE